MSANNLVTPHLSTGDFDRAMHPKRQRLAIPFCLIVNRELTSPSRPGPTAELEISTIWSSSNRRPEFISTR
jgi:hypothetical protein